MPPPDFTSTLTGIPAMTPAANVQTGSGKTGKTATAGHTAPAKGIAAVQAALEQIRKSLASSDRSLEFQADALTGLVVVTIRDAQTGEVMRQIPGNVILSFADTLTARNTGGGPAALVDLTA